MGLRTALTASEDLRCALLSHCGDIGVAHAGVCRARAIIIFVDWQLAGGCSSSSISSGHGACRSQVASCQAAAAPAPRMLSEPSCAKRKSNCSSVGERLTRRTSISGSRRTRWWRRSLDAAKRHSYGSSWRRSCRWPSVHTSRTWSCSARCSRRSTQKLHRSIGFGSTGRQICIFNSSRPSCAPMQEVPSCCLQTLRVLRKGSSAMQNRRAMLTEAILA
mmetsp:Transcript_74224/g.200138  ORF Transcript_74224/g.200138 Transcript_74224/m.200138 type:complete len:219 (-) Transcript_74224:877-1533(-)